MYVGVHVERAFETIRIYYCPVPIPVYRHERDGDVERITMKLSVPQAKKVKKESQGNERCVYLCTYSQICQ